MWLPFFRLLNFDRVPVCVCRCWCIKCYSVRKTVFRVSSLRTLRGNTVFRVSRFRRSAETQCFVFPDLRVETPSGAECLVDVRGVLAVLAYVVIAQAFATLTNAVGPHTSAQRGP